MILNNVQFITIIVRQFRKKLVFDDYYELDIGK